MTNARKKRKRQRERAVGAAVESVNPGDFSHKPDGKSEGEARAEKKAGRKSKKRSTNSSFKRTSSSTLDTTSNVPAKKKMSNNNEDEGPAVRDGGGAGDRREGGRVVSGGRERSDGDGNERRGGIKGGNKIVWVPKKPRQNEGKINSREVLARDGGGARGRRDGASVVSGGRGSGDGNERRGGVKAGNKVDWVPRKSGQDAVKIKSAEPLARDCGGARDRRDHAPVVSGGRESGDGTERRSCVKGGNKDDWVPKKSWKDPGKTNSVRQAEIKEGRRKDERMPDKIVRTAGGRKGKAVSDGRSVAAGSGSVIKRQDFDSNDDFNIDGGVKKKGSIAVGGKRADDGQVMSPPETTKRPSSSKKRERSAEGSSTSTASSKSLSRASTTKGQEAKARREAKGGSKAGVWRDDNREYQETVRLSSSVTGGRPSIAELNKTPPVERAGVEADSDEEVEFML